MDAMNTKDLSRAVLAPDWNRKELVDLGALSSAIAELESRRPLLEAEPNLDGAASRQLEAALRPIGAKIDPRISADQAEAWRKAMLMALSDLTPSVAIYAVRKAIHEPMSFLNEVEGHVRTIARAAAEKQRTALYRLKLWRDEINRAMNPPPALEAPPIERATQQEVDEFNAQMIAMPNRYGIRTRARLGENGTIETYTLTDEEHAAERAELRENSEI